MRNNKMIPSNYTLEEIIKYHGDLIPEQIQSAIYSKFDEIDANKRELEQANKRIEYLNEQIYFRDEFIGQVQDTLKRETRATDIKKVILNNLENSYIEL